MSKNTKPDVRTVKDAASLDKYVKDLVESVVSTKNNRLEE